MKAEIMLSIVLFLALYGIACLLHRLSVRILQPTVKPLIFEVAYLRKDTENIEQIVRYFRLKAEKNAILLLVDNGVTAEQKAVMERLCASRRDVRFLTAENFVEENCICGENGI